ncbi:unnamed protein product [Fusarium equiseti]|uniref:Uncharacterized protein n=1 Tax=Fusarium equiseti TaxID=61235 RepID=A0A8J2IID4_FUSEQ|nr:unnamed protein product [Fusarium equiseti]
MPGDAVADLCFIKELDRYRHEKPYLLFVGKPASAENEQNTNVELETVTDIPIHDVRGSQHKYNIDDHGFQFVSHQQTFSDFENEDLIDQQYLPQVQKVISENIPYAKKVFVFDWRVSAKSLERRCTTSLKADDYILKLRKQMTTTEADETISPAQLERRLFVLAPSQTVHSGKMQQGSGSYMPSLLKRVKHELPHEADKLLQGRVQMIK